jgi:hypothetical protein
MPDAKETAVSRNPQVLTDNPSAEQFAPSPAMVDTTARTARALRGW